MVRLLAYEGDRIFTTDRARELAPRVGLKDSYLGEALYHLRRNDWIVPLRRGLYALSSTVPGVSDAHEFEVAMALVNPAAISHWSAIHYHGLTEQVPREVFVLTTTESSVPRIRRTEAKRPRGGYPVGDTTYRFVQVRPERFFGTQKVWVGDARVSVTDVERTLLDGLSMPQHCGDFAEVLHAFQVGMDRLDIERIARYATRLGAATVKRLGWVLEYHGAVRPASTGWRHCRSRVTACSIPPDQEEAPATAVGWSRKTFRAWWMRETSPYAPSGSAPASRHPLGGTRARLPPVLDSCRHQSGTGTWRHAGVQGRHGAEEVLLRRVSFLREKPPIVMDDAGLDTRYDYSPERYSQPRSRVLD